MQQPALIRLGCDGDAPGITALIAACWSEYPAIVIDFAEAPDLATLATHTEARGGAVWVAEAEGAIVGLAAACPAEGDWHLARMYVAAPHRGTGLAAHLLATAQDHARAAGATRMVLWSDLLFTRGHAFYEKHGFLRRGGLRALHDRSNTIEARFSKPLTGQVVEELDVAAAESAERPLAALSQACAAAGSQGPAMPPERPVGYWHGVTRAVGTGNVRLFVAWRDGMLAGTVQVALDQPETKRHRADVCTLLVAPGDRCRGMARGLMMAAENAARAAGRRLLVFEAAADEHAEPLYRKLGWVIAGTIPGGMASPDGSTHDARIYCKMLQADSIEP